MHRNRSGFNPTRVRLKQAFVAEAEQNLGSFNPTRVRLKQRLPEGGPDGDGFNPTRVRLKHDVISEIVGAVEQLQPHEGSSETIKSRQSCVIPTSFNPTRVRLKPGTVAHYVGPSHQGFNPTRVRLKHAVLKEMGYEEGLQPHEGSSETRAVALRPVLGESFNPTRVRLKPCTLDPLPSVR